MQHSHNGNLEQFIEQITDAIVARSMATAATRQSCAVALRVFQPLPGAGCIVWWMLELRVSGWCLAKPLGERLGEPDRSYAAKPEATDEDIKRL